MKVNAQTRERLFFVCILARIIVASMPLVLTKTWAKVIYTIAITTIAINMWRLTFSNNPPTVGGFGGPTWWTSVRWIHGIFYSIASISMMLSCKRVASLSLFIDAALGFYFFKTIRQT